MTSERIGCCVPFCRRTRSMAGSAVDEWICGQHWKLTDHTLRAGFFRWEQRAKRVRMESPSTLGKGQRLLRIKSVIWHRYWERLKKQAIERSAGL